MRTMTPISAIGDLVAAAEERLLRTIAGENHALAGGIRRTLDAMRAELCAADAPCTERLLVDQILLSWLEVYSFQLGAGELLRDEKLQRSYDRIMRRYQAAILALARLQKLNLAAQRTRSAVAASSSKAHQPREATQPASARSTQPVASIPLSAPQSVAALSFPQTPQRPPERATAIPAPASTGNNQAYPASKHSRRRSRLRVKKCSAPLSREACPEQTETV